MSGRQKVFLGCLIAVTVATAAVVTLRLRERHGAPAAASADHGAGAAYVGSSSCRECHERFYQLWAPSHHGKAMQPFTAAFAAESLTPQDEPIDVAGVSFRADVERCVLVSEGPAGRKEYPIEHALGGKNVFYFLTPLDRGRLQVIPVAYDVHKAKWIDTTGSMVRHFSGLEDEALPWTHPMLTFNTACYSCHVSQLSRNYDLATDTYHTVWQEPGINCETCHGPASEHIRVFTEAHAGTRPKDIKLIVTTTMTRKQRDDMCAPCHAKMRPLTPSFTPGERFFDHFDLVCVEDPDFYPDGRDLGENYTYTGWLRNPCALSGELECLHCHTSSGRFRFLDDANAACLPCHKERVANAPKHTHHEEGSEGNKCIACHMPLTAFAHMNRSDHSMAPPAPAATLAFKSPNACNLCHKSKDAAWADKLVREWRTRDYQAPVLARARLLEAARKKDWAILADILDYIGDEKRDAVFATALIRLLSTCPDERKWPALLAAMTDLSPLVRSAAAYALTDHYPRAGVEALLKACRDEYRVVRVAAASALTRYPRERLSALDVKALSDATVEFVGQLTTRPDEWSSHYNLGNFHADQGRPRQALKSYAQAASLRGDVVQPLVNAAMVHARLQEMQESVNLLRKAVEIAPLNPAANFNLALALAERNDRDGAEKHLRAALKGDPTMAEAAYNLGVLLSATDAEEGLAWCGKAAGLAPRYEKYVYTYAFYLSKAGKLQEAADVLETLILEQTYPDACFLLGQIYESQGRAGDARTLYEKMESRADLRAEQRNRARFRREALGGEARNE